MHFPNSECFARDTSGVIAIKFALFLPVLLTVFGFALDQSRFLREQNVLQSAADSAAIAAAKELSLADRKYEDLAEIAQSIVLAYVASEKNRLASGTTPRVETHVVTDPLQVEVKVGATFRSMFENFFHVRLKQMETRAVARIVGKPNVCVLGLNSSDGGTISLEQNARVTGQNCAVYSNSDNARGLKAKNSASLTASVICSRGGKDGGPGNFKPAPIVDCPSFDDPLIGRPEPASGPCDPLLPTVVTGLVTLAPGTYCGLEIEDGGKVTLLDGVYVFKDEPLVVRDGGSLSAASAGLFFTGKDATFTFEQRSTISLAAPTSGTMAGLLIFAARSQDHSLEYKILSDDARVMVGTIYIPKGELYIDAQSPVADHSAYTAIVADKMRLYGGPHLVLNTNYANSDVPVPDGIGGVAQPVVLAE